MFVWDRCKGVTMIVNRVTLLGNKDHGKSTLIGSLLIGTGSVSQHRIDDAKKTSEKLGRRFEPGYMLDSFEEERLNEMTIDTTRAQVKYKNTGFEFIDVPGHEELMKNMLSGASYADFALLLVSAKPDEGITGQTKRHLFVAKMFGIERLVVAINKLDSVNYSQERFERIKEDISIYLDRIGFKTANVSFVPISAYNAENLVKRSDRMKWYRGKSLMGILVKASRTKKERDDKQLVIQIQGLFEGDEKSIFGKVISGKVKEGDSITLLPLGGTATVLKLFVSGRKAKSAGKGGVVTMELDRGVGSDIRGFIAVNDKSTCRSGDTVRAILLITKKMTGKHSIKINGIEVRCRKMTVDKSIDVTTGESKTASRIKPLDAGVVELKLDRNVATDAFERTPEIGRFVFYTNRSFSGIGIITE